jgi:hypothetical protein
MPTRRQVLAGLGTAGAATVTTSIPVRGQSDDEFPHYAEQPNSVSLEFDATEMAEYQPLLRLQPEDDSKLLGLYGWKAVDEARSTDVYCYWTSYSHQEASGLGRVFFNADQHYGDHEPVQVVVDSDTGDVQTVRASIYHWIKGETTPTDRLMDETGKRPRLRVINPWHQYTLAKTDAEVQQKAVEDLRSEYRSWLRNGLAESVAIGATTNPWTMADRSSWWREGTFGIGLNEQRIKVAQMLGLDTVGELS